MNSANLISEKFSAYKSQADYLLKELENLTARLKTEELQKTISNLRSNINDPFLFVVVGEVKSGKSSFVNALLGAEICKVAPEPMTDRIQQIVYGEREHTEKLSDLTVRLYFPEELLKDIAIVDTPGTNTVIEEHQEITKEYIPNSDLVFFVFPAKNPHTKSSWDLLSFVADEWKKNIIFILQQKDLTTPHELQVNREKVREYALNNGMRDPVIFATSARWENENQEDSGFNRVRSYIRDNVTGDQNLKLKLQSILNTTENILSRIESSLNKRRAVYEADLELVTQLKQKMESGERQSQYEIERLSDRITRQYEHVSQEMLHEFEKGLTVFALFRRSFKSIFSSEESMERWLENLQKKFEQDLNDSIVNIAEEGSEHFVNGIKSTTDSLIDKMSSASTSKQNGTELFADTIRRREELITRVKGNLLRLKHDEQLSDLIRKSSNIRTGVTGGSALTVVGAVILFSTHIAFFDITGGVLTTAGILISSGYTVFRRKQIIHEFEVSISKSKDKFRAELLNNLTSQLEIIYEEIKRYFSDFFDHVEQETHVQRELETEMESVQEKYQSLRANVESL